MTRGRYLFFFNDTATTEIYTLSLHDALPIFHGQHRPPAQDDGPGLGARIAHGLLLGSAAGSDVRPLYGQRSEDRKSTRLNSSHANISYAVFCLKKKNTYSSITRSTLIPPLVL